MRGFRHGQYDLFAVTFNIGDWEVGVRLIFFAVY